jgi:hypothetical protein
MVSLPKTELPPLGSERGVELRHGAGSRSGARLRAWESKPNRRGVDIKTDKFSGLALPRGDPFSPPTQNRWAPQCWMPIPESGAADSNTQKSRENPPRSRWDAPPKFRFAGDSPLEGDGFEPSVPLGRAVHPLLKTMERRAGGFPALRSRTRPHAFTHDGPRQ